MIKDKDLFILTFMSEYFVVQGGKKLEGRVQISGAKNSAGPILAATVLTKEDCVIDNLPLIKDVYSLLEVIEGMGAEVEWLGEKKVRVRAENIDPKKITLELINKTRFSVLLLGSLLTRCKEFKFFPPGGDKIIGNVRAEGGGRIGIRPITTHLEALAQMGLKIERDENEYYFSNDGLRAGEVSLKEFSVTATENVMMAAAGTEGKTTIHNAAAEPHVKNLGEMLSKMGAKVSGLGTHTIIVEGSRDLGRVEQLVYYDYLEAGTLAVVGAVTEGVLEIENFPFEHMVFFLTKFKEIGVKFERIEDRLRVEYCDRVKPVRIQSLPHPGFPTDLLPIMAPLLTQAEGRSLFHDPLYENRLSFMNELRKMGGDIEITDPHRAFIFGKTPLSGVKISSWDIRAGASLVVASLMARGESVIHNIHQVDRGYERFDEKLNALGADIKRVEE